LICEVVHGLRGSSAAAKWTAVALTKAIEANATIKKLFQFISAPENLGEEQYCRVRKSDLATCRLLDQFNQEAASISAAAA
jgi:hypothetical protein